MPASERTGPAAREELDTKPGICARDRVPYSVATSAAIALFEWVYVDPFDGAFEMFK